jgi:hypothetical protein
MQCCTQICRLVQPSQNLLGQCYHIHNPALLDFNLFTVLKKAICSTKFGTDDDVIHTVRTWLHEQNKAWYQQGIRTLAVGPEMWMETVEKQGMESNHHSSSHVIFVIYK